MSGPAEPAGARRRARLNRDRILRAAVAFADEHGIAALSMRNLAQELGVVPMALYNHVAHREELLDGMVDVVVGEIDPAVDGSGWKGAVRGQALSARATMLRHPWARAVIESRAPDNPTVLAYMDSVAGLFRAGGFSVDLTHHAMHAFGFRMWGFSQETFDAAVHREPDPGPAEVDPTAETYPHILDIARAVAGDGDSVAGTGCDTRFEFSLDLLLDGFERLQEQGWTSSGPGGTAT